MVIEDTRWVYANSRSDDAAFLRALNNEDWKLYCSEKREQAS